MERLREFPPEAVLIGMTMAAAVGTVIIFLLMRPYEATMKATGGYGIVPYELAYTPERARSILTAWGDAGQRAARSSLLVDFAFMPAYGLMFAGVTLLITRGLAGRWERVGLWLAVAPIWAAVLDALENVMLLSMLGKETGGLSGGSPLVAGIAATIKFGLLAVVLIFWLAAGARWAFMRTDKTQE